ncbi:MAG: hypothetical protein R3F61_18795 [Myxococcota bacterium]
MVTGLFAMLACSGPSDTPTDSDPPPREPDCPEVLGTEVSGIVPTPPATELSGIAISGDRVWVHNDNGPPTLHALAHTGGLLGTTVLDASGVDLEDLAIGPGPDGSRWLFLGDIGDNLRARVRVSVLSFPEPAEPDGLVVPTVTDLVYEDGARDAEALFVDDDGVVWIVSKEPDGASGVYRAGADGVLHREQTLLFGSPPLGVATLVTGGDFGPHGLVLRTYLDEAYVWPRVEGSGDGVLDVLEREPCPIAIPQDSQGEAIAWGADGVFTVSEGESPPLHHIELSAP